MKYSISFLLLLCAGLVSAQAYFQQFNLPKNTSFSEGVTKISYGKKSAETVLGSKYLVESWISGSISMKDKSMEVGLNLRYNIYSQQMELVHKGDTLVVTAPFKIDRIQFAGKEFLYCLTIDKDNAMSAGYFEVLVDGEKCKLLLKREITVREDSYSSNYMGGGGSGMSYYAKNEHYYMKKKGEEAIKISKSKRKLLRFFSDKNEEIEAFIQKENLMLTNYNHLVKLIRYYNSL